MQILWRRLLVIFFVGSIGVVGLQYIAKSQGADLNLTTLQAALRLEHGKERKVESNVLGVADSITNMFFHVAIPATFDDTVTFTKPISAPNLIQSITAGDGIAITLGPTPAISNTGIRSLVAGSGISVDGNKITNSGITSLSAGTGISVSGSTITNSGITSLTAGTGISVSGSTITNTLDLSGSGWTDSGTTLKLTTITDSVGIGIATPTSTLHVVGTTNLAGDVTLGSSSSDDITVLGAISAGSSIIPSVDLGADLGSSLNRFNNIWAANINSNSSQAFSGQTTFSYAPTDTTLAQTSVIINPTTSAANGQLLGLFIAGYQKALIDEDGDIILGYSDATSAPATDYPLNIYGHSGTRVAYIDTSGNALFAGLTADRLVSSTTGGLLTTSISSANAALSITDETGTAGSLVFSTSPTFTTDIRTPLVIGSTSANGTLTFEGNNTTGNTSTNANLVFKVGDSAGTTAMTILNSGNVGIGTTAPGNPLMVVGGNTQAIIRAEGTHNAGVGPVIEISNTGSSVGSGSTLRYLTGAGTTAEIVSRLDSGSNTGSNIQFWNRQSSTLTESLRIDSSGKVGIGTSSPDALLTFSTAYADPTTTPNKIQLYDGASYGFGISSNDLDIQTGGNIRFLTGTTELMAILSGGNVGIGTTTPTSKLHVSGKVTGKALAIFDETGDQNILTASASGTPKFTIDRNGYVTIGTQTVLSTRGGASNLFVGDAPSTGTNDVQNTAIGISALDSLNNTTGIGNTALGYIAGTAISSGDYNTLLGHSSGTSITAGSTNTALGYISLQSLTTGSNNTAIGYAASYLISTTSSGNTAVGAVAGGACVDNDGACVSGTDTNNVFVGYSAGENSDGARTANVIIGYQAGYTTWGSNNVFIGDKAGFSSQGDSNVFIGSSAGYNETGSNLLYIDNSNTTTPLIWGDFSANALNFNGNVGIGTTAPTSKLHITGAVTGKALAIFNETGDQALLTASASGVTKFTIAHDGVITTALGTGTVYSNSGTLTNTDPSDINLKKDVLSLSDNTLSKVLGLRPVSYNWKSTGNGALGFIAQEVQEVFPELVGTNQDGTLGLYTTQFIPILAKAIQEQQLQIDEISLSTASASITNEEWGSLKAMIETIRTKLSAMAEKFTTKESHQEKLCVGTSDKETCVTQDQLDTLIKLVASPTASVSATSTPTPIPSPTASPESSSSATISAETL